MSDELEKKFIRPTEPTTNILETPDKTLAELVKLLGEAKRKTRMFSHYNKEEIRQFAMLESINGVLNSEILTLYIESHDERRVSLERLGRKEIVLVGRSFGLQVGETRGVFQRFTDFIRRR